MPSVAWLVRGYRREHRRSIGAMLDGVRQDQGARLVVMRRPLVERSATARSGPLQSDQPVEHPPWPRLATQREPPLLVADSKDLQLVQLPIRRYGYIRLADLSGYALAVHEAIVSDGLLGGGISDRRPPGQGWRVASDSGRSRRGRGRGRAEEEAQHGFVPVDADALRE
jgi:hypothetical protein